MSNTAANYLKKKKMYELLQSLVQNSLDIMKNTTYKFHRGSEWIECQSDNREHLKLYKLYHISNFYSLEIFQWNEKQEKYIEIERITYRMLEGHLVKKYQRTEAYKETEEIRSWIQNHTLT